MAIPAIDSTVEAAYWFIEKAEKDGVFLDDEKLHYLLFLSQASFAVKFKGKILFPGVFVTSDNGVMEPNIAKIFSFGRPYMPPVKIKDEIVFFMEEIWKKYASQSTLALANIVKSSTAYKNNHKKGEKYVVDISLSADLFQSSQDVSNNPKKMLFSQNGPVMVSKWTPRKVNSSKRDNKQW